MNSTNPAQRSHRKQYGLVLLVAAVVGGIWMSGQYRLRQTRQSLAQTRERHAALAMRLTEAQEILTSLQQRQRMAERERDQNLAEAITIESRLGEVNSDASWIQPPSLWPSWPDASPYVWLSKESLAALRPPVFNAQGALHRETAEVMDMDRAQIQTVNAALAPILEEYRHLEIQHAERLAEPLAGISDDQPFVTLSVPPFPEDAQRLRAQFTDVLHQHLGDQRAELLLQAAGGWMNKQFNIDPAQPTIYSVVRHPDGSHNISISRPFGSSSIGGVKQLEDYLPHHLLPAFDELRFPAPPEQLVDRDR